MAQTSGNSAAIIEDVVYTSLLQESFSENILGMALFNDMTGEFPTGDRLDVEQIGDVLLVDYAENGDIDYKAIDTSRISLQVTDYPSDGWFLTDVLKQDSHKANMLISKRLKKAQQAFAEQLETAVFAACNAVQTAGSANNINGQPHRSTHNSGTTAQEIVNQIAQIKLSFDKAKVPESGRILIVDPTLENKLNQVGTGAVIVSDSPRFEGLLETGFARNHRFVRNIHGFDLYTSNLLPVIASETVDDAVTNAYCNIAMCIADDDCKPVMGVLRQMPRAESGRNKDKQRDEWVETARWGFATYRPESVFCMITEA